MFHLIKLNVNGTYLTVVDPVSKPRIICFSEVRNAYKCIEYVSKFRSKHGVWPTFDMSNESRKLQSITSQVKTRTPESIMEYMDIETFYQSGIDEMSSRTNVSFYCVLHFDAQSTNTEESIRMSGLEMDGEADDDMYRTNLKRV